MSEKLKSKNSVSMSEMLELLSAASQPDGAVIAQATGDELTEIGSSLGCSLSSDEKDEFESAQAAVSFLGLVRGDLNREQSANLKTVARSGRDSDSTWISGLEDSEVEISDFTELGRFEIIKAIGQGGFAKVFLAIDPLLDRQVALKIPKPEVLFSVEARDRFQREAKSAAVLSHPSIVPVFESGAIGPITYIASGYCPGPTLAEWFADAGDCLKPELAAEIMVRLADAIQHAHQRGVIHRDLKPANILVEDGQAFVAERIRITDFGLAKKVESEDSVITLCGAVVGTPAYMSPEQATGQADIDLRTDIFSLGAIFYELLTGKIPFKRSNNLMTLRAVETEAPIKPRRLNSSIPKDLEAICLKCLAKDPSRRYESAHLLARDLENALAGRTIIARPASSSERIFRWVKRNPALAVSQIAAFLFLVIGLTITTWQWQVNQASLLVSNQQKDRAETNVSRLHETVIAVLDRYRTSIENDIELTETDREVLGEMLGVHKRLIDEEAEQLSVGADTLNAYVEIARLYRELGQLEAAQGACTQARDLIALVEKTDPAEVAVFQLEALDVVFQEALIAFTRGFHIEGEALFKDCSERMEQCEHRLNEIDAKKQWMRIHRHLGLSLLGQRKFELAAAEFEFGMEYAAELIALDPEDEFLKFSFGRSFQDISNTYRMTGRNGRALECVQTALSHFIEMEKDPENEGDYRYRIAFLRSDIGSILNDFSKLEQADEYLSLAVNSLRELHQEKPLDAIIRSRLTHALVRLADLRERQEDYVSAIEVNKEGLVLSEDLAGERNQVRRKMFFRYRHAKILHEQFDDPDLVVQLVEEAIQLGEYGLRLFPGDYDLLRRMTRVYQLRRMVAAKAGNDELALEMAWKSAEQAVSVLLSLPNDGPQQRRTKEYVKSVVELESQSGMYDRAREIILHMEQASPSSYTLYHSAKFMALIAQYQTDAEEPAQQIRESKALAINQLELAVRHGFSNPRWLAENPEWDAMRDLPEFKKVQNAIKANLN